MKFIPTFVSPYLLKMDDVFEVPTHYKIYIRKRRYGDVRSIVRRRWTHDPRLQVENAANAIRS